MTTTTVSAATGCGGRQRSRPRGSGSIAGQIKDQRRGYARAVLRALARAYQGRPTAQVQRVLKDAFKPLGRPSVHRRAPRPRNQNLRRGTRHPALNRGHPARDAGDAPADNGTRRNTPVGPAQPARSSWPRHPSR